MVTTKRKVSGASLTPLQLRRKVALLEAGLTATDIARAIGVSSQMVSLVLLDRATSRRVAEGIAQQVGVAMGELFPDHAA